MYRDWAGHDPSIQPYLEYYGLHWRRRGAGAAAAPPPPGTARRRRRASGDTSHDPPARRPDVGERPDRSPRGRRAGGAGHHHARQQPARRRGGRASRSRRRSRRPRRRRASPTASCRSSAASARPTSRRCRRRSREAGGGKMLAFCRSGTRSALRRALAHREEGASREDVAAARWPTPASTRARSRTCSRARTRATASARRRGLRRGPSLARRHDRAFRIAVALRVEHDRFDAVLLEDRSGTAPPRYGQLKRAASTSSLTRASRRPPRFPPARGARPSIALRCGKRPNRSMIVVVLLAR